MKSLKQGFGDAIPNVFIPPHCGIFVKTENSGKNSYFVYVIWL